MAERPPDDNFTDHDRAGIVGVADAIALVAFALVDGVCVHQPPRWSVARIIAYVGLPALFVYFTVLAGVWQKAFARAREDTAPRTSTETFGGRLYLGAILNMAVVSGILVFTGGTQSPFMAYPGGFVLFSQFLADSRRAVVLSLIGGIGLILALWLYPGLPEFAGSYALPPGSVSPKAQQSSLAIVSIGAIFVGTICTIPRRKPKTTPSK